MRDSRRDWRSEAERKLANSKLSPDEREEISRELAGYLEDLCADAPSRALGNSAAGQIDATQIAGAELQEDKNLGAHLYRACREGNMNDRTRQLWLPGVTILAAAVAFSYLCQVFDFGHVFWVNRAAPWVLGINIPALFGLPLLGAAAAYWSRAKGARRRVQAAAGLFPFALVIATLVAKPHPILGPLLPIRFASRGFGPFGVSGFLGAVAWTLVTGICIPLTALLIGVLPVLRGSSASPDSVRHA